MGAAGAAAARARPVGSAVCVDETAAHRRDPVAGSGRGALAGRPGALLIKKCRRDTFSPHWSVIVFAGDNLDV